LDEKEVMDAKWIRPQELEGFAQTNDWNTLGLSHKVITEASAELFGENVRNPSH